MITVKQKNDSIEIISNVTDFSGSIGYCEYQIDHALKGIKPPESPETIKGTEIHEKEEKYEEEHFEFIPLTAEELKNKTKDIELAREKVYTRYLYFMKIGTQRIRLLLKGRADKIYRSNGRLFIEDTKTTRNPERYLAKFEPYDNQKLQALVYLNSLYTANGSFDQDDWFSIPHNSKAWIIKIKDSNTEEIVKVFETVHTMQTEKFLKTKIERFILLTLGMNEKQHHRSFRKCKSCRFSMCKYRLN